jgi:rhodanese-related sulfurtransferase
MESPSRSDKRTGQAYDLYAQIGSILGYLNRLARWIQVQFGASKSLLSEGTLTMFIHALAIAMIFATEADRTPAEFTEDSLAVVKENVTKGKAVLVDVRSKEEWDKGHIEGSIFLPVTSLGKNLDAKKVAETLPKDKILYTFCVVGMRSKAAAKTLDKLGYGVRALKPGYDELIAAGFKRSEKQNENARQRDAQ